MPGCAAIGCNNRSEKGYSMKCFPRDPLLRQQWKERVGRANWEPSKNSFLCHDHFESDQWAETENGKIRLKRDAIPSIFKETSTRKSPRKRRLENGNQNPNVFEKNTVRVTTIKVAGDDTEDDTYTLEYLDDCEYEMAFASIGNTAKINAGKSSGSHLITAGNVEQQSNADRKSNYELAYRIVSEKDMRGLEKENIIIVSDENNREIGKLIHNNESVIIVADEDNKEIGQIIVEENSLGANLKEQDNYDEIEEKLKQICNGEDVTVTLTTRRDRAGPSPGLRREINGRQEDVVRKEDTKSNSWTADSKFDKEIPSNVKIIFGTESGEESREVSENNTPENKLELKLFPRLNEAAKNTSRVKDREIGEMKTTGSGDLKHRSLNDPLRKSKAGVVPLKQQRRTREDVMRSIEKAIAELSERTLQSVQNDKLTRSILRIARARKKGNIAKAGGASSGYRRQSELVNEKFQLVEGNSSSKKSKFTIKVTGVADDVSEIIEGLETNSMKLKTESKEEEDSSLKYVVAEEINERDLNRIDGRFIRRQERGRKSLKSEEEMSSDFDSIDFAEGCIVEEEINQQYRKSNRNQMFNVKQETSDIETLFKQNKEFIHTEEFQTKMQRRKLMDEENGRIKIEDVNSEDGNNRSNHRLKYFNKTRDHSRGMQQKINAQQEVIEKLTNQLIIYKGLEAKLVNLNFQLQVKNKEIQVLKDKLERKSQISIQDPLDCKEETNMKEKTISDLSNKVNRLKEANKRLMQQITSESQNKKLSYHLKQRDDQIKELNWKLEKASKFLDRAEKNANTYKRKMVSMQTSIRRQKASDEKRNHFQELLIDNAKHEFSESALLTAMDIKNSCGIKCYQKLLSYNFPLPSLRTLRRRFQKENVTEDDWGDEDQEVVIDQADQNIHNISNTEGCQSHELGETEVTGTVQDIFEENNDTEEMNSSELGEQIFLQLNNERQYTDT